MTDEQETLFMALAYSIWHEVAHGWLAPMLGIVAMLLWMNVVVDAFKEWKAKRALRA